LFFVGLSRARDYLSLSRAERYTSRRCSESRFLGELTSVIPQAQYQGSGRSYSTDTPLRPQVQRDGYPERELDLYMQCPARYRYEVIEELRGGGDNSAYMQFHRCVYITVGWLEEERQKKNAVLPEGALAQLATVWEKHGPVKHAFEDYYRTAAENMIRGMMEAISSESGNYDRQEWVVPVDGRRILITPDRVVVCSDGTIHVQRIRTGRKTKSEHDKPIYALLRRGAHLRFPGRAVSVETFYLGTGEVVPVIAGDDEKLLAKYSEAIVAIEGGDFHPEPDARRCPNCQCYFMCGG
jgi:DNA helicase II / ATP-dependent DNA helicase PcrA